MRIKKYLRYRKTKDPALTGSFAQGVGLKPGERALPEDPLGLRRFRTQLADPVPGS